MADDHDNQVTTQSEEEKDDAGKVTGKYLQLRVNDFAIDPVNPASTMSAFLRLGAADNQWEQEKSKAAKLEEYVHTAGPTGGRVDQNLFVRDKLPSGDKRLLHDPFDGSEDPPKLHIGFPPRANANDPREATSPPYLDDRRVRAVESGAADPDDGWNPKRADDTNVQGASWAGVHGLKPDDRAWHSDNLHTRGGWRDHSDGNRITTTWGDKVEVIRGNYKMVVLGRQDDTAGAMGWDASGQHIQDYASTMPGASVRVEWQREDQYSAWHLLNTTEGVIQTSTKGGNFYEFTWGEHVQSTTGTWDPQTPERDAELRAAKDAIFDAQPTGTYKDVTAMAAHPTGSGVMAKALRVQGWDLDFALAMKKNPIVIERKWAQKLLAYRGSESQRVPRIYDETWADKVKSVTKLGSSIDETLMNATHHPAEVTTTVGEHLGQGNGPIGLLFDTVHARVVRREFWGNQFELNAGDFMELFMGTALSLRTGASSEVSIGAAAEVFLGLSAEVFLGVAVEVFGFQSIEAVFGWKKEYGTQKDGFIGKQNFVALSNAITSMKFDALGSCITLNGPPPPAAVEPLPPGPVGLP